MNYNKMLLDLINSVGGIPQPLVLGGVSAENGGAGGPPGGFLGKLPQTSVAADLTEAETLDVLDSGASLLNNLNRIRARIRSLESESLSIGLPQRVEGILPVLDTSERRVYPTPIDYTNQGINLPQGQKYLVGGQQHTHQAEEITAGTLSPDRLPLPTPTTLGGVKRNLGQPGQAVIGISETGDLLYGDFTPVDLHASNVSFDPDEFLFSENVQDAIRELREKSVRRNPGTNTSILGDDDTIFPTIPQAYQVASDATSTHFIGVLYHNNLAIAPTFSAVRMMGNRDDSPLPVAGTVLARFRAMTFEDHTRSNFRTAAEMRMVASENFAPFSAYGTSIQFFLTRPQTAQLRRVFEILPSGGVNLVGGGKYLVDGEEHEHEVFSSERAGFVPPPGDNFGALFSDGTWRSVLNVTSLPSGLVLFGQGNSLSFTDITYTNGRYGFGTANPISKYHFYLPGESRFYAEINNTGTFSPFVLLNSNTSNSAGAGFLLAAGSPSSFIGQVLSFRDGTPNNANLSLRVLSSGTLTTFLSYQGATRAIQLTGSVGINTNAPAAALHINSDSFILNNPRTISSSSTQGSRGQICWDSNYLYVCVNTNQWKRIPLQSF